MYRLLLFLRRIYVPLIFLVLELVALHLYATSSAHSRARMLSVSDNMMSGVYRGIADVESYTALARTNRLLERRVQGLENELAAYREFYSVRQRDSVGAAAEFPHKYVVARVIRNSVNRSENYIMIDRGTRDSVERGMAVLSLAGGMVGYVESCSARSAICTSVLNTQFRASGTVEGTGHFGSISWEGGDPRFVKLSEVPKYARVERGDTILTSGYSFNFPPGIFIGTIADFSTDEAHASHNIDVRLGVDIASLKNVILVASPGVEEFVELEKDVLGGEGGR